MSKKENHVNINQSTQRNPSTVEVFTQNRCWRCRAAAGAPWWGRCVGRQCQQGFVWSFDGNLQNNFIKHNFFFLPSLTMYTVLLSSLSPRLKPSCWQPGKGHRSEVSWVWDRHGVYVYERQHYEAKIPRVHADVFGTFSIYRRYVKGFRCLGFNCRLSTCLRWSFAAAIVGRLGAVFPPGSVHVSVEFS